MSEESTESITKSGSNFAPIFVDHHLLPDMNFNGHYLINSLLAPKKLMNLYISYSLSPWLKYLNTDFTLNSCLFGSGKLTKNRDSDKYKYSGYNIGFDSWSEFSLQMEAWEKMSFFVELIWPHLCIFIIRKKIC